MPWLKACAKFTRPSLGLTAVLLGFLWINRSGRVFSGYDSLTPDSRLHIGGRTVSGELAARSYLPFILPGDYERPRSCLYELGTRDESTLEITYRFLWPDERHPRPLADAPYRLWRALYYGSAQDIESVLIEVDRPSGALRRIVFESPRAGELLVDHIPRSLDPAEMAKKGSRVFLRIASWNHLFEPASAADPSAEGVPLEFLRPELYRDLRINRISQPAGYSRSR